MPKGISDEDLRAAQSLKDERDFKYSTNQSLQAVNQDIVSLSSKHDKAMGQINSDHKYLLIEFENLREWILKNFNVMNQRLGDVETKLFEVLDQVNDIKDEYESTYMTRESFWCIFDGLSEQIAMTNLCHTLDSNKSDIKIDNLKSHIRQDLQKLREELTPKTPEVDPVDIKLDERFKTLKVDFDGLVKEISLLKRSVFYDQKKFENIYTLIERMKEGK